MSPARRVRIPADTDRPDPMLGPLSARQSLIAGTGALVSAAIFEAARVLLPVPVAVACVAPVVVVTAVLVFAKADGVSADRLAFAALRHLSSPTQLLAKGRDEEVGGGDGDGEESNDAPAPFTGGGGPGGRLSRRGEVGVFSLPVEAVLADGVIDLGTGGSAMLAEASTINFSLRSPEEQETAVASFANLLNGLEGRVSFHLSSAPVDVSAWLGSFDASSATLPPQIAEAAASHREFVLKAAGRATVSSRRVVIGFHATDPAGSAHDILVRRIEEAAEAVAHLSVSLTPLGAHEAIGAIGSALAPAPTEIAIHGTAPQAISVVRSRGEAAPIRERGRR